MCLHLTRLLGLLHISLHLTRLLGILHITAPGPRPCVPDALRVALHSECAFILQGCWEYYTLHTPHAPARPCVPPDGAKGPMSCILESYLWRDGMLPMASSHPNLRVVAWRDSKQASKQLWVGPEDGSSCFPPQTC